MVKSPKYSIHVSFSMMQGLAQAGEISEAREVISVTLVLGPANTLLGVVLLA